MTGPLPKKVCIRCHKNEAAVRMKRYGRDVQTVHNTCWECLVKVITNSSDVFLVTRLEAK